MDLIAIMRVKVDVFGFQHVDDATRRFALDVSEDTTVRALNALCAERAGLDREETRVHAGGKAADADATVEALAGRAGELRVALMANPEARRRTMAAELEAVRASARSAYEARRREHEDADATARDARRGVIAERLADAVKHEREIETLERFGSNTRETRMQLARLSDALEKTLLFLDGVDATGDDGVRAARKDAVRRVVALADRVDAMLALIEG